MSLPELLADVERSTIREALREKNGNRTEAAKMLGIPRRQLYRRLAELFTEEQLAALAKDIEERPAEGKKVMERQEEQVTLNKTERSIMAQIRKAGFVVATGHEKRVPLLKLVEKGLVTEERPGVFRAKEQSK